MVSKRHIVRGELIIEMDFIKNYHKELNLMNLKKEGRPFKLSEHYIHFLAAIRHVYDMPYRKLERFASRLGDIVGLPSGDYTGLRRRMMKLNLKQYESFKNQKDLCFLLTNSGINIFKWTDMQNVQNIPTKRLTLHFAIDMKTKEVVAMELIFKKLIF